MTEDKELAANLRLAKTKPMFFSFVAKGTEGKLLVDKKKISAKEAAEAKKECNGGTIYKGRVTGADGTLVFEMGKEAPGTLAALTKKIIKRDAALTLEVEYRFAANLAEEEMGDTEGTEETPEVGVVPTPPPLPTSNAPTPPPLPTGKTPPPPPPPMSKAPPSEAATRFVSRLKALALVLEKVEAINHATATQAKSQIAEGNKAYLAKSYDEANAALDRAETLLKLGLNSVAPKGTVPPTPPLPGTGVKDVVPPTPPSPGTGVKDVVPPPSQKPTTDGPPRPSLRREVPDTWTADKIVTDELFDKLLEVHKDLFDGSPPTTLPGVSFAIVDKLDIGVAYVKAQVWNEKEDGPFNPAKNKDHAEMALAMAPAMVTIIPSKDPTRTVYVNKDYFEERNKGEPNYDEVNAVMLHEAHHASSKGFVNFPFFDDHDLSWGFDECATEYFTKKVWDSKYSDRKDEYFKYTNYFKDAGGKKGWYGEAGAKLASELTEKVLAAAYFSGDEAALKLLKAKQEDIKRIVRTVKS